MKRKIMIVEDNVMNRKSLRKLLNSTYEIIEAENGEEALRLLNKNYKSISAIILDLIMPVMDGFAFLEKRRNNASLSQIPVIVATIHEDEDSEVKALALGANDFITKPYNPALIMHSLRNTINMRETASIINALQTDRLTGLYNREAFFDKSIQMLNDRPPGYYVMSCFDIDNFKVINDQYGTEEGDRILKHIGHVAKDSFASVGGICGRIFADNFAALYPAGEKENAFITKMRHNQLTPKDTYANVVYSVGRYVVTDLTLSAGAIYDRAYIAKQSGKGIYNVNFTYFNESMRAKLIRKQEIISDMDFALAQGQFEVWFQPQFNHSTGALVGAEALVRWRHPRRGLLQPGEFIATFEQNGFIYELDKYVWEQSCRFIRKWLDAGVEPVPISVNVSRFDLFKTDLIDVITGLMDKYDLPVQLLSIEITESAFAKSPEQLIIVVRQLMEQGFAVHIDDFGSGYSSLNTLKDVPADVIKLDMRFLENNENSNRGGNILESVVRMAKWLDVSVIAEGVETVEQADFLKSIGCDHIQGYLYSKPISADEYEIFITNIHRGERTTALKTIAGLDNNSFWEPQSMDTLIFNSYVGSACIFEYNSGDIEFLRINDKFMQSIGSTTMTVADVLKLDLSKHIDRKNKRTVTVSILKAIRSKNERTAELIFCGLPGCPQETYLRVTMRVIASSGKRFLVYCISENITAQKQAERKERKMAAQLQAVMDNIDGGVSGIILEEGTPVLLFANNYFYRILGYTREEYEREIGSPYDFVYGEDRERVFDEMRNAAHSQGHFTTTCRLVRRDKTIISIQNKVSVTRIPGVEGNVLLTVSNDIT